MGRPCKYNFKIHHDRIKRVYEEATGNGEVEKLARELKIPRCSISRYAINKGLLKILRKKEPRWTDKEIKILESNARFKPETICKRLKKYGYDRTISSVVAKRSRMRYLQNLRGQTAQDLAYCFGVDRSTIFSWIQKGYLIAEKRGLNLPEDKDHWYITNYHIKKFIQECIDIIDLRKVDKWWFIDLAFGGSNGLSPLSLGDSAGEGDNFMGVD